MRILTNGRWQDGFLDFHRPEDQYRIQVLAWKNLSRIKDLYFVRRPGIRLLLNYLREVGVLTVARKIVSRRNESVRNEKYVACGVGRVLEGPAGGKFHPAATVCFLAPSHPPGVERVVVPEALLAPWEGDPPAGRETPVTTDDASVPAGSGDWWAPVIGWSSEAGILLHESETGEMLSRAKRVLATSEAIAGPGDDCTAVTETRHPDRPAADETRVPATLFGYGNYAKTVVLPNVRKYLRVTRIHELDPTQIPLAADSTIWDTRPSFHDADSNEVYLVAGYHHTHALLAAKALRSGRYAVVEKPITVDCAQHTELVDAVRQSQKFFACFHKRYFPLNETALQDLRVRPGEPVSYHCVVYEVPLPELHWYRWPNSKSRLVSNGCHWLDHFLFLNGFASPHFHHVSVARDGTINCSVELENGAFFTMVLTDQGSERIGVQDYVELRANGVTVKMTNGSEYMSESSNRILRRRKMNKMLSYQEMYRTIGRKIIAGEAGDSLRSVEVSSSLVLALEAQLSQQLENGITSELALVGR